MHILRVISFQFQCAYFGGYFISFSMCIFCRLFHFNLNVHILRVISFQSQCAYFKVVLFQDQYAYFVGYLISISMYIFWGLFHFNLNVHIVWANSFQSQCAYLAGCLSTVPLKLKHVVYLSRKISSLLESRKNMSFINILNRSGPNLKILNPIEHPLKSDSIHSWWCWVWLSDVGWTNN